MSDPAGFAVRSAYGTYDVDIASDASWTARLAVIPQSIILVDELVWEMHRARLTELDVFRLVPVKANEDVKSLPGIDLLCDRIIDAGMTRSVVIVAIGGGVIQDVAGFLASILYRGVDWTYVPTTLLAQADSCIGSKTSINHRGFKNLLGTMKPPTRVIIDPAFIATLNRDDYASGLGEIAKMHLVAGREASDRFEALLPGLLARDEGSVRLATGQSLAIKRPIVEEDEFDRGPRRLLNYGHCFGHAIESATDFAVPHGQAVVLGILLAGELAARRGYLSQEAADGIAARILVPVLTAAAGNGAYATDDVIAGMRRDKKRTGPGLAVVLPHEDGSLTLETDVEELEAIEALRALPGALEAIGISRY